MLSSLTRANLVQTLTLIDPEDSANSLLLRKALEPHGGAAKPPLTGRDAPAYIALEEWVLKTYPPKLHDPFGTGVAAAENPTPTKELETAKPVGSDKPRIPPQLEEKFASLQSVPATPASVSQKVDSASSKPSEVASPRPSVELADPFDPVMFNQRYHPTRRQP